MLEYDWQPLFMANRLFQVQTVRFDLSDYKHL